MSIQIDRRNTCRLCLSGEQDTALSLRPSPLADDYLPPEKAERSRESYPLEVRLCRDCGQVQLHDVVTADSIYCDYIYQTALSPGLQRHFGEYADQVLGAVGPESGSLTVDVGCNDGVLLRCFRDRGMTPLGVEPASAIAATVEADGIPVRSAFLTREIAQQLRAEYGPARLVTANNVMANVDDVEEFVLAIRDMLADDGVFVFETGYLLALVENTVFDNIYHEHLSYFAVRPLARFFQRLGMELFLALEVPTKGGSLRGFVQRAGAAREGDGSVARLVAREEAAGLFDPATYRAYGEKLDAIRESLYGLLDETLGKGDTLVGYGASATCTTVLHHFGLGDRVHFLVDDNPLKQGTRSPGLHLPVHAPEEIYRRGARHVLVLPWRFASPIMEKHQRLVEAGGCFLRFLPRVEKVGA